MNEFRDLFLLDPEVVFLNHGSFGATPRPVFDAYQAWQRKLERQPVQFLTTELGGLLATARRALGAYLNVGTEELVYVPNATTGVNIVARSLELGPGDEVLATDHEYGACDRVWQFLSRRHGFRYLNCPIPLPLPDEETLVETLWAHVTPHTRVIFISHITSPTAVRFPVERICARAREAGILTLVDGAHAPGQIPLDLKAVGADFYTGNAHKWLCAPKGSAFLYARAEVQHLIHPLIVSWGWNAGQELSFGSDFLNYLQWTGTQDISAYLSVPAAIDFQAEHDWPAVRLRCHGLAAEGIDRINALTGLAPIYPPHDESAFTQMALAELPQIDDLPGFKVRMYNMFRVEIPCIQWNNRQFIRISVQAYNSASDIDALLNALGKMLLR